MLIFDSFPSRQRAEDFAKAVRKTRRKATVHDSQEESDKIDPFPYRLTPPIVLVDRNENLTGEMKLQSMVSEFRGEFAGT